MVEWNVPLFQLKRDDAPSEVKFCETKIKRASATTGSTHAEKEVATAPNSDQSLDLNAGADSCSSTSAQSLQFANFSNVVNTISPSSASATCY